LQLIFGDGVATLVASSKGNITQRTREIMRRVIWASLLLLASSAILAVHAQNQTEQAGAVADAHAAQDSGKAPSVDYPRSRAGIFIQGNEWTPLANQNPTKTKTAHGLAAGLSYGIVPAKIVAEYDGDHASAQTETAQPTICICHFFSIPGAPVLVRLHPKKGERELDGGRMIVYPVVGGSKMADANKTDLVPADVSQPEPQYWVIRPQSPLDPGEYALMLGTQNISIFPFTVLPPSPPSPAK
jgi:hypothetical protein